MPSGKHHDRITLWLLPLVLIGAFFITLDMPLTVIVGLSFLLSGLMMGPDLDIQSVQYRRWGLMRWIWYPYQVAIKHRSRWSHGPLIGTIVRVLYLGVWIALFATVGVLAINHFWQAQLSWQRLEPILVSLFVQYWREWLALLVGLELGALSHYTSDWLVSAYKKKRRHQGHRKR
ncbi:metal-binding protein [Leptolyngbyaceae cyanobacterium CCMR0082]|uniref:Metal-binding protein n=1 Tax=Adonisia turfae CCMR0082 TaxID=2304604 RepID=A0A6M0SDP2_9CYAN|nr:metal-binding protein [Adonisia turfae]MDV3351963.1 metal-binding protein [Leptothoe sp. LEGE 181152]NEZ66617.1 metal-binding protein [Adonisia turfae CCMR0082]